MADNEMMIRASSEMVAPPASIIDASLRLPPRDMVRVREQLIANVCSSPDVARACIYCVPVGKDKVTKLQKFTLGESIRMAECAQDAFGRCMVDLHVEERTATSITVKAMLLDLQTLNIYPGLGTATIYSESRAKLAMGAAASIARRNAMLSMVKPYTQAILPQVKAKIVEGIGKSTGEALQTLIKEFAEEGVTEAQLKDTMANEKDNVDRVVKLVGILNGIRDHMYTAEEIFGNPGSKPDVKPTTAKKAPTAEAAAQPPKEPPAAGPVPETPPPAPVVEVAPTEAPELEFGPDPAPAPEPEAVEPPMELGAFKEALMGLAYKLFDTHKERTDWLGRNLKNMNHKSASAVPDADRAEVVTKFSILAKEITDSRKA